MSTPYNNALEQAQVGQEIIDDTSAHTGNFGGILVLNDAVISAITAGSNVTNSSGLTTITLSAGTYIPVPFTSITLTSGVVSAINRYS